MDRSGLIVDVRCRAILLFVTQEQVENGVCDLPGYVCIYVGIDQHGDGQFFFLDESKSCVNASTSAPPRLTRHRLLGIPTK